MKNYGKLEFDRGRWRMTDVEPHVSIRLKANFPGIPFTATGDYTFPDLENVCTDLLWFLQRYPMEMSDGDRSRMEMRRSRFEHEMSELGRIFLPEWVPPPQHGSKPPFKLWRIQEQAAEIWRRKKRLILTDPVGQGKTFSALGGIIGSEHLPAAIVAKTHLPNQWVNEYIRPHTYLSAHIIESRAPYSLPAANVYIFKYSNIAGWVDIAAKGTFRTFVADEVHELRHGESTDKGKAAKVFCDNAVMAMGMSATPIFNYGDEAFNIVNLFIPGILGTWEEFCIAWCTRIGSHWVVKDPDALGTYLRELNVMLHRPRDGRPVNKQMIEVPFDVRAEKESSDLEKVLAIKAISGVWGESGQAARELDQIVRHDTGVGKAIGVAGFVRMLLKNKRKVLLFGWHRDVYDIWRRELAEFNPVLYTGSETTKQKDAAKAAFINGATDLCILSLRSGDGVDGFQKVCHTVVYGELDWSPMVHEQAVSRVDRTGQTQPVIDAFYCVTDHGSDPTVIETHGIKRTQARGIVTPLAGVETVWKDESRVKKLAENYLKMQGIKIQPRLAVANQD